MTGRPGALSSVRMARGRSVKRWGNRLSSGPGVQVDGMVD